jgi:hypothetical protein
MRYARLIGDVVAEIFDHDDMTPADSHVPEIAAQFVECPADVQAGWTHIGGDTWAPPAQPVIDVPEIVVGAMQFLQLFTSPERIAIKSQRKDDPVIDDFFSILDDPRLTEVNLSRRSVIDGLDYLASKSLITADRKAEILSGKMV